MITIQTALPMFKLFSSKTGTHAVNQHNFVLHILTICSLKPTDILLEPHIDNISPFRVYPKTIVTRTCSILPPSLKTKNEVLSFTSRRLPNKRNMCSVVKTGQKPSIQFIYMERSMTLTSPSRIVATHVAQENGASTSERYRLNNFRQNCTLHMPYAHLL